MLYVNLFYTTCSAVSYRCDVVRKCGDPRPSITLEKVRVEDLEIILSIAELQAFAE